MKELDEKNKITRDMVQTTVLDIVPHQLRCSSFSQLYPKRPMGQTEVVKSCTHGRCFAN